MAQCSECRDIAPGGSRRGARAGSEACSMKKAPRDRGAFPCCFGRLALEGYTKMSQANATASRLDRGAESLRERIARYLAGDEAESNWSVVIGDAPLLTSDESEPCRDCDGLGFVVLPEPKLKEFAARIAHLGDEAMLASKARDLESERRLSVKIRDEHWKLNRESVCRTCRGSCYAAPKDGAKRQSVAPDGMFTTVTCPRCRGSDRRNHPRLMEKGQGSSCGSGCPSIENGGCGGAGYLVPITARPVGKGGAPGAYAEELEDVPVYHRATEIHDPGTPETVVTAAFKEDPKLAAAMVAYLGASGDEWGKHSERGRRFAVWPFVASGERLVAEAGLPVDDSATWYAERVRVLEAQCLTEEAEKKAGRSGDPRRRMLIRRADQETRWVVRRIEQIVLEHEGA